MEPRTILFSGHDLRFIESFINYCEKSAKWRVLLEKHNGHEIRDTSLCLELLPKAQVIFCEWALGNAVWYSKHKLPGQTLVVRLHAQELRGVPFLDDINWDAVDALIMICPLNAERVVERYPSLAKKTKLIFNPIDCANLFQEKLPRAEFNLGIMGICPMMKRVDLAFEIFQSLKATDSRYMLLVKGKAPQEYDWLWRRPEERAFYESFYGKLEQSGLRDSVVFEDYGCDVAEWLSKVGFILSTSDFEGSHQAVAEGMASGAIPVIRNWAGATQMYPEKYVWSSVQEAVAQISNWRQPPHYIRESEFCSQHARERFDQKRIFSQLEDLLHRCGPYPAVVASATSMPQEQHYTSGRIEKNGLPDGVRESDKRVLLYGSVNTNIIDGSSVWLINVAKVLSCRYKVDLLLKAKITSRHLLSELEVDPNISILPPDAFPLHMKEFGDRHSLSEHSAAELMAKLDAQRNYAFVLCRGKQVNHCLALNPRLNRKLIAYFLLDYHVSEPLGAEASIFKDIVFNANAILAQTESLKEFMRQLFGCSSEKFILLPPMVDSCVPERKFLNRGNVCLYAGKFDLDWRIDDILNVFKSAGCPLRLIGNKFHMQQVGAESLKEFVLRMAQSVPNIHYLGAIDHKDVPAQIDASDFGISVRVDRYLASKEFSTKVLEFGARGKPSIVNDSAINREFLGPDYPLFANSNGEIADCLKKIQDAKIYSIAAQRCHAAAGKCTREKLARICDDIEERLQRFSSL